MLITKLILVITSWCERVKFFFVSFLRWFGNTRSFYLGFGTEIICLLWSQNLYKMHAFTLLSYSASLLKFTFCIMYFCMRLRFSSEWNGSSQSLPSLRNINNSTPFYFQNDEAGNKKRKSSTEAEYELAFLCLNLLLV